MPFSAKLTAFLAAIRVNPNVTRAAEAADMDRGLHYLELRQNPEYRAAYLEALEEGFDTVADIAVERASIGWEEPVVYQGQFSWPMKYDPDLDRDVPDYDKPPLCVRKIDNGLLQFVLRSRHPEFKEKKEEVVEQGPVTKVIYEWVPRKSDTDPGEGSPPAAPAA